MRSQKTGENHLQCLHNRSATCIAPCESRGMATNLQFLASFCRPWQRSIMVSRWWRLGRRRWVWRGVRQLHCFFVPFHFLRQGSEVHMVYSEAKELRKFPLIAKLSICPTAINDPAFAGEQNLWCRLVMAFWL